MLSAMSRRFALVLLLAAALAGCALGPMPEGTARGLIAFDPTPPSGAEVWERPSFRVGDRYTLLQGGVRELPFAVVQADDTGVVVQDARGFLLRRDPDLGYLGQWNPKGEPLRLLTPVDARFHWPLWVGKSWRCEILDRRRERPSRRIEVEYRVEDQDRVTVPGGTFDTLRIARVERLLIEGETFLERTSLTWYAPAIGLEVRQLNATSEGTMFELASWTRAADPAGS